MAFIISRISNLFKNLLTLNNKIYKLNTRNLDITINIESLNLGREIKAKNIKGLIILKNYIPDTKGPSFISNILENIFNKFFLIEGEVIELEFCLMDKQNFIFKIQVDRFSYVNRILLIEHCIIYTFNKGYKQINQPLSCVLELFDSMNIYLSDILLSNMSIFDLIKIVNYNLLLIGAVSSKVDGKPHKKIIQIPSLEGKFKESLVLKLTRFYLDFTLPNKLNVGGGLKCECVLLKMKQFEVLVMELDVKLNFFLVFMNREVKREILNYIFTKDKGFRERVSKCVKYSLLRVSSIHKSANSDISKVSDKDISKVSDKELREKYIIGNVDNLNIYFTDSFILELLELIIIISNLLGGITFNNFDFDDLRSYLTSETQNSLKERLQNLNLENMSKDFPDSDKEEISKETHLGLYFAIVYTLFLFNHSLDCKLKRNSETLKLSTIFDEAIVSKEDTPTNLLFLKTDPPCAIFRLFFIELIYTKHKGIIKLELTDIDLLKEIILRLVYSVKRYSALNCYEEEFGRVYRYLKVPVKNSVSFLNLNNLCILVPKVCVLNFDGDFMRLDFVAEWYNDLQNNDHNDLQNKGYNLLGDMKNKNYSVFWDMKNKDRNTILGTIKGTITTNILKKLLKIFNTNFINKFMKILETKALKKSFLLFLNYRNYAEYARKAIRIRNTSILNLNINLKGLPYPFKLSINTIDLYENLKNFMILKISYKKSQIDLIDNKIVGLQVDYSLLKKIPLIYNLYNKLNKQSLKKDAIKISFKDLKALYNKISLFINKDILKDFAIREMTTTEIEKYLKKKLLFNGFKLNFMNLLIDLKEDEIKIKKWISLKIKFNEKTKKIDLKGGCVISFYKLSKLLNIYNTFLSVTKINRNNTSLKNNASLKLTGKMLTNLFFVDFKFVLFLDTFYRINLKYEDSLNFSIEENCTAINYFYYVLEPVMLNRKEFISLLDLFLSENYTHIELTLKKLIFNIQINSKSKLTEFINHKLNKKVAFNYTPNLLINNQKVRKYGLETSQNLNYKFDTRTLEIKNLPNKIELSLLKDIVIKNNTIFEIKVLKENKEKILKTGINSMKYIDKFQIGNQVIKVKELKGESVVLISMNVNNVLKYFKAVIKKGEQVFMSINPCISLKNEVFTGCVLLPTLNSVSLRNILSNNANILSDTNTSNNTNILSDKEIKGSCLVCGFKNDCKKYLKILIGDQTINVNYSETLDLYDNYSYYLSAEGEYPPCFKLVPKNDTSKRIGLFLNESNRNILSTFSIKQEEEGINLYVFSYKTLIATNIFSFTPFTSINPINPIGTQSIPNTQSGQTEINKIQGCKKDHFKNYVKPVITINKQILKNSYTSQNFVNTLNEDDLTSHTSLTLKINKGDKHKLKLRSTRTQFLPLKDQTFLEVKPIFINNNVIIVIKLSCECEKQAHNRKYSIRDTQEYLKYLNTFDSEFFNCHRVKLIAEGVLVNVFSFNHGKFYEGGGLYEEWFWRDVDPKKVDLCPVPWKYKEVINKVKVGIEAETCELENIDNVSNQLNGISDKGDVFSYLFNQTDTLNSYTYTTDTYTQNINTTGTQNIQSIKELNTKDKEIKEIKEIKEVFKNLLTTKHIFKEESYKIEFTKTIIRFYGILGKKDKTITFDYDSFQVDNPLMNGVLIKGSKGFLCAQIINKYVDSKKYTQTINDVIVCPNNLTIYLGALSSSSGELPNIKNLNLIIQTPLKISAKLALATIPIDLKAPSLKDLTGKDLKLIFPSIHLINSNLSIINKYLNKCLMNSLGNNILKNIPGIGANAIKKVFGKVGKGVLFNLKSLVTKNEHSNLRNFGFDILMTDSSEILTIPSRKFMFSYLQNYYDFYREYQKVISKILTPLTFDYSLIKIEKQNRFIDKLINDSGEEKRRRISYPIFAISEICEPKILYACLIDCEIDYSQILDLLTPLKTSKLCQLINNLKSNPQKLVVTEDTEKIVKFYLIVNTMILTSNVSIVFKEKERKSYLILCKYFVYVYCFGVVKFKDIEILKGKIVVKGKYVLITNDRCYEVLVILLKKLRSYDLLF